MRASGILCNNFFMGMGRGVGRRKLEGWKIGQDEAHLQNLFYYSVMQYPIIVNEQFFINH